jgi:myo-inositol-1(or 4)-monophosphatase
MAGRALGKHAGRTPARTMREFRATFDEADGAALEIIRPALTRLRPDAAWGDEIDTVLADGEQWIVDAIDGAVQYLQDLPQWSVSATLLRDGQPAVAVLHNPGLAETYVGLADGGATRNGAPVAPSAKTDLSVTLFATSQPPSSPARPERSSPTAAAAPGPPGPTPSSWRRLNCTRPCSLPSRSTRSNPFSRTDRDRLYPAPPIVSALADEAAREAVGAGGVP